ncbi:alcohol dehydrogenase class IV [Variovorax guangxiensis]|nr:alcohol dehydrogenase class IV [Variovorax guangxiensis]
MERIAKALGGTSAAQSVFDLAAGAGATMALKDLDMRSADLDRACEIAMTNPYRNPRPLEAGAIRQLLQDAFDGVRPSC